MGISSFSFSSFSSSFSKSRLRRCGDLRRGCCAVAIMGDAERAGIEDDEADGTGRIDDGGREGLFGEVDRNWKPCQSETNEFGLCM